jgi:hypothetical protein
MKSAFLLIVCASIICLAGCNTQNPELTTIKKVKIMEQSNSLVNGSEDKDLYVEGYYYNDPVPLLITDPKWTRINSIMPDSVYLVLPNNKELTNGLQPYQGQKIRIKGKLNRENNLAPSGAAKVDFVLSDFKVQIILKKSSYKAPQNIIFNKQFAKHFGSANLTNSNYALLYSGGYNLPNAKIRYWNDLKLMYQTLKNIYGYDDAHIIVVYKDGIGQDNEMPVNFPANKTGLAAAFHLLGTGLNNSKNLLLFITNHGGGYDKLAQTNEGGVNDINGDEINPFHMDEVIYYYNDDNNLLDDDIALMVNSLHFNKLVTLMEPCYGGGFLRDLRGANRVIMSASSEFEVSYSNTDQNYDVFSYFFTIALNDPAADLNKDGRVSMLEAYKYAKANDKTGESPELEDNGDGVGSSSPGAPKNPDGALAAATFIN